jgi:predicted nucleic acid-binding protein
VPNLIVADSGPIISFARAGRLQLIRNLYKQIIIPNAVYEEIVVKGANKPGATEVKSASWITVRKAANRDGVEKLLSGHFDFGESEAIILAGELGGTILRY